jgi:hypothetical protein
MSHLALQQFALCSPELRQFAMCRLAVSQQASPPTT